MTPYTCAHRWALTRWGGALEAREEALAPLAAHEVTVRITHSGLCHSDLHIRDGGLDLGGGRRSSFEKAGAALPLTLGHEICGEVVETGPEVAGIAPGTPVVVFPWLGCGECSVCAAGDEQLCPRATRNLGMQLPGGFADLVRVPHARYLVPLGGLNPAQAATFACAGITAYGAIRKLSPMRADDWVAVLGCGGVGMTAVSILAATSPARVVALDTDPAKREAALRHGASAAFDPSTADALKVVSKHCGFNVAGALDFVGAESTAQLGANLVRRCGELVIVGLFGGEFRFPLPMFAMKSLSVRGSYSGSLPDLRALVALAQQGKLAQIPLDLRPLHTVNQAFDDLQQGKVAGRVVLQPA